MSYADLTKKQLLTIAEERGLSVRKSSTVKAIVSSLEKNDIEIRQSAVRADYSDMSASVGQPPEDEMGKENMVVEDSAPAPIFGAPENVLLLNPPSVKKVSRDDKHGVLSEQMFYSVKKKVSAAHFSPFVAEVKSLEVTEDKLKDTNFLTVSHVILGGERVPLIDYVSQRPEWLWKLFRPLGVDLSSKTVDVVFDLFCLMCCLPSQTPLLLSEEERKVVCHLKKEQLHRLLGQRYAGPTDCASLLFALVTGHESFRPDGERDLSLSDTYRQIREISPQYVWTMTKKLEGHDEELPPYLFLSTRREATDMNVANVMTIVYKL